MAETHVCPICKAKFDVKSAQDEGIFPFCSERCKLVDLGKWLDGQYTIASEDTLDHDKADTSDDA